MRNLKSSLALLLAVMMFGGCNKGGEEGTSSISLSQKETYDFPAESGTDYPAKEPLTVTVTNTGTLATGKLTIAIDGAAAAKYTLSATSIANIEPGKTDTFTVVPDTGLGEGEYLATVYVSGKGIAEQSFKVRFVVTDSDIVSIRIDSPPTQIVYGVGEPINIAGLAVTAINEDDSESKLDNLMDYVFCDDFPTGEKYFSSASPKNPDTGVITPTKVRVSVGAAPVKEFEVTVLSLVDRIKNAAGKTETIIVYGDEMMLEESIGINVANTDITLTTPEGSTDVRTLKKADTGYLFNINGGGTSTSNSNVKLTVGGYITLKGWATSAYGGSDEFNNNNPLILVQKGGSLTLKGHSKVTGNCTYKNSNSATTDAGAINVNVSQLTICENAQVTNNCKVNAGTGANYAGAIWCSGNENNKEDFSTVVIKDNAKITGNKCISTGTSGNTYGGAIGGEVYSKLYVEGGEFSGNLAQSNGGSAGGGAFCLLNGTVKCFFTGGTVKDNAVIYKGSGRGSAFVVGGETGLTLSGSVNIVPGSETIVAEGADHKKDAANSISMSTSAYTFNIMGELSAIKSPVFVDIHAKDAVDFTARYRILRKCTKEGEFADYTDDAPAGQFTMRNFVNWGAHTVTSLSDKMIGADGYMTSKQ